MGYVGLASVSCVDGASDLCYDMEDAMIKVLREGLKEKGNKFNPNGFVNVALIMEERITSGTDYASNDKFKRLAKDVIEGLVQLTYKNHDEENKKAYKRLIKELSDFIKREKY